LDKNKERRTVLWKGCQQKEAAQLTSVGGQSWQSVYAENIINAKKQENERSICADVDVVKRPNTHTSMVITRGSFQTKNNDGGGCIIMAIRKDLVRSHSPNITGKEVVSTSIG
jgi:hypothetical protein